jgi:hypothetical protein
MNDHPLGINPSKKVCFQLPDSLSATEADVLRRRTDETVGRI